MKYKQPFIWSILTVFRKIVTMIPHSAAVIIGGFLGSIVPIFTPVKLKEATDSCARGLASPRKEARRMVRRVYTYLGKSTAEFIRLPVMA